MTIFQTGDRVRVIRDANPHVVKSLVGREFVVVGRAPDDDGAPAYWVDLGKGKRTILFDYMVEVAK